MLHGHAVDPKIREKELAACLCISAAKVAYYQEIRADPKAGIAAHQRYITRTREAFLLLDEIKPDLPSTFALPIRP